MSVRPHLSPARGMAVLVLLLLAACAPPLEQARLPGQNAFRSHDEAQSRSRQLTRMGRTALDGGDLSAAAGLFEQALILDGDNEEAAVGYGDVLLRQNRPQEASEVYGRAFFRAGAPAHYGYGRAMIALGRPEAAVEHLRQAHELSPADPTILNALGVAHDMAGQHAEAARAYREGLAIAPDDRGLKSNLGLSLALAGDVDAAIATLRPLAEGPESDKRARQNLALAFGLKGDVLAAERLSRVDLDPDEVRRNLAVFAALRGTEGGMAAMTLAPDLTAPPPTARRAARRPRPEPAASAPAPPPSPPQRGPVPLTALALEAGDLAVGASPVGSWFVRLGRFESAQAAAARWHELRQRNPQTLGSLSRLAGAGSGPEPLLVGPLPDEAAAQATCSRLRRSAPDCAPVRL